MSKINLYHSGSRKLQREFGTTQLADRLVDVLAHAEFSPSDRKFIESRPMFFLSTADSAGKPDCSYKGGDEGFLRIVGPSSLEFPSYDGNGMFKSLGNILVNPNVGLLFIDFDSPRRLRVNGQASVRRPQLSTRGAEESRSSQAAIDPEENSVANQLIVRVEVEAIFPNCPRYIHPAKTLEQSADVPRAGQATPIPEWKMREQFNAVLPDGDPAKK